MKKLLILGASEIQLPLILKAKELGCYTIVADINPEAVGLNYADEKLLISTNDTNKLLVFAKKNQINGIITSSDYPVRSVAAISEVINLTGPSAFAANLCTNKYLMREHLEKHDFLVPKYCFVKSRKCLQNVNFYPCIIKPIDSSGSRGVKKVEDFKELLAAYEKALSFSKNKEVIVEEFINGNEYSIESLTQKGETHIIAITQKTVIGDEGKFFVEDRHVIPAKLSLEVENILKEQIKRLLESIRIENSASHTEVRINSKGIYIIESGARLGGDYITSDLVPLATGVDMLEQSIKIALNEEITVTNPATQFAGIQFINSENYVNVVNYLEKENKFIVKKEIKPFKQQRLTNSFARLGYFIACTKKENDLIQILDCN